MNPCLGDKYQNYQTSLDFPCVFFRNTFYETMWNNGGTRVIVVELGFSMETVKLLSRRGYLLS